MSDANQPQGPEEFQDPLENYDPKVYADPLEQALAEDSVGAIRHHPVTTVAPDDSIEVAMKKLVDDLTGCLLVQEDGRLIGVFSDRDVLNRVALEYDDVKDKPVRDFMTSDPVFVYESDKSAAALSVMAVSGFRHVPVTDLEQNVLGIVTPRRVTGFLRKYAN